MIAPEDCDTMAEVRAGIDALDLQIVDLLAIRFRFMTAAARIKADRGAVRDEAAQGASDRQRQGRGRARWACRRRSSARSGRRLVEGSIAYEFDRWDEHRA